MSANPSLFENLKQRRVLPIVGMYIASTWLVIELGDWATERFGLPPNLTSYVFVAMLVMLPAMILFAYNHGAPGKDKWTATEKALIPLNAVLALLALYFISPLLVVEAATETVQIADETGVMQEFEVARQGYHKEVIAFFWQNESADADLNWLSYGLPLMLSYDLNRVSPVIDVETPFDSFGIRTELKNRGFESLLGEPQGLRVEIARDRRSAALIVGSFDRSGEALSVEMTLFDAESGSEIGSHTAAASDWLSVVDKISVAVLQLLDVKPSDNQSDDPVSQHFSDSLEAIRHYTIGQISLDLNNDYPAGIQQIQSALELDPSFAEASGTLSITHYLNGDTDSARTTASQALQNGYRLSESSKFRLKANRYMFDGDYERGERVVQIWTQVQPNSTEAFRSLAMLSIMRGTAEALDNATEAYDRLLELDPTDVSIYQDKAEVEQQRGDFTAAAAHLRTYLEYEPNSGDALRQLADIFQAQGDLDAAQALLEDAAILSDSPLESEIGLARLEARRGLYNEAEERLAGQLKDAQGSQQRLQVLSAQAELAFVRGNIRRTMELHVELNDIASELMPPMIRLLRIESQEANLLMLLGKTDEALMVADRIAAQLQPPIDAYLFFSYTSIYEAANNREAFRELVDKTKQRREQIAAIFQPFIEMQAARIAIWDDDRATAVTRLDRASDLFGQSALQVMRNNLSMSSTHVAIARLYLEAAALDQAQVLLDEILKVFPSYAYAKLMSAKVQLARGDEAAARELLGEALGVWSEADPDYVHRQEAASLLENL